PQIPRALGPRVGHKSGRAPFQASLCRSRPPESVQTCSIYKFRPGSKRLYSEAEWGEQAKTDQDVSEVAARVFAPLGGPSNPLNGPRIPIPLGLACRSYYR